MDPRDAPRHADRVVSYTKMDAERDSVKYNRQTPAHIANTALVQRGGSKKNSKHNLKVM